MSLNLALGLIGTLLPAQDKPAPGGPVLVLTVVGDVNPVLVSYLRRGIETGVKRKAELVLLRLNTPGGQLQNTREIAQDLLASEVPIGVYVWPDGAHAGSAGTFITVGAHVAAMAPETNLGAAHPVQIGGGGEEAPGGEQLKTLTEKVTNDAAALIRNLARKRGRNAEWAEKAVRESVVATADEALKLGVIDFVAQDLADFLRQADGRHVQLKSAERTLHTTQARIEYLPMNWQEKLLFRLAHPNIAYLLMIIGVYGLIFELKSPGFGGAGIAGAICLILGLYCLSVLEASIAGVALILVGIGFLFGELVAPTHGLLTLGGAIALTVGSLILFNQPGMQVSRPLIAGVVVSTVGFFVFALGAVVRSQKRKVVTGAQGIIGMLGQARTRLEPEGTVFAEGTLWTAETRGETIEEGETVEIIDVEGLRLIVRRRHNDNTGQS
ncbi:MAG: NfeD family protein [Candidatus Zipacnadales bacterium]